MSKMELKREHDCDEDDDILEIIEHPKEDVSIQKLAQIMEQPHPLTSVLLQYPGYL